VAGWQRCLIESQKQIRMTRKPPNYLRRYTDLPALLHMLTSRRITLLDPKSWDDLNDAYYLAQYKERKGLASTLALCFSRVPETYHHWHVFSRGPSGVCVVFNRTVLLETLQRQPFITASNVQYLNLVEAKRHTFKVEDLPFLKRAGFKPEGEFRIIYESPDLELTYLDASIDLACIRSVSLSPWLNASLTESTVKAIRSIDGCGKLKVSRSTLISNEQWKAFGRDAT